MNDRISSLKALASACAVLLLPWTVLAGERILPKTVQELVSYLTSNQWLIVDTLVGIPERKRFTSTELAKSVLVEQREIPRYLEQLSLKGHQCKWNGIQLPSHGPSAGGPVTTVIYGFKESEESIEHRDLLYIFFEHIDPKRSRRNPGSASVQPYLMIRGVRISACDGGLSTSGNAPAPDSEQSPASPLD